jgi:hypothetical protein
MRCIAAIIRVQYHNKFTKFDAELQGLVVIFNISNFQTYCLILNLIMKIAAIFDEWVTVLILLIAFLASYRCYSTADDKFHMQLHLHKTEIANTSHLKYYFLSHIYSILKLLYRHHHKSWQYIIILWTVFALFLAFRFIKLFHRKRLAGVTHLPASIWYSRHKTYRIRSCILIRF